MTWVEGLPMLTGIAYLAAAIGYYRQRQLGFACMYLGYSFANVGLIWAAMSARH